MTHHFIAAFASLVVLAARAGSQSIPPQLVGTWNSSEVRSIMFQDRATGAFSKPSGTIIEYQIAADGSYKENVLIQTSMYNCSDSVFISDGGLVRIEGSRLVFESTGADLRSTDNCNPRFNYTKKIPPKRYVRDPWLVRAGQSGLELCMVDEKQNHACYRRKD